MIDIEKLGLPTLEWGEIFHIGINVDDIPSAQAELTKSMNLNWTPTLSFEQKPWVVGQGYQDLPLQMSHSVEGPIHLELLHGPPGSIWDTALNGGGLHHIGVWVEDVKSVNETLVEAGWRVEMAGASPQEGYGHFTYIRSPAGLRFEPESCMGGGKERFASWWAGGSLF